MKKKARFQKKTETFHCEIFKGRGGACEKFRIVMRRTPRGDSARRVAEMLERRSLSRAKQAREITVLKATLSSSPPPPPPPLYDDVQDVSIEREDEEYASTEKKEDSEEHLTEKEQQQQPIKRCKTIALPPSFVPEPPPVSTFKGACKKVSVVGVTVASVKMVEEDALEVYERALLSVRLARDLDHVRAKQKAARMSLLGNDGYLHWLDKFAYMVDWRLHMFKLVRQAISMGGAAIVNLDRYTELVGWFHKFLVCIGDRKRKATDPRRCEQFVTRFFDAYQSDLEMIWQKITHCKWGDTDRYATLYGPLIRASFDRDTDGMTAVACDMQEAVGTLMIVLRACRQLDERLVKRWEQLYVLTKAGVEEIRNERQRRIALLVGRFSPSDPAPGVVQQTGGWVDDDTVDIDYGTLGEGTVPLLEWPLTKKRREK